MRTAFARLIFFGLLVAALSLPAVNFPALAQQQKPPKAPDQQKEKPQGEFALSVEVPLVSVDVVITDNNGTFLSGLQKGNFRVLEDGVPQVITNFSPTDAPITMVLLVEFSNVYGPYIAARTAWMAQNFLRELKPDDWIALITFDLRSHIEADFTRNKMDIERSLRQLFMPSFSEACVYDALYETVERLQDVKGKKAILLIASGRDTFSKKTLDDILKRLRETDVTIFTISSGKDFTDYLDSHGYNSGSWGFVNRMDTLQAENQMRAFASLTGGRSWAPQFEGEWPGIFSDVAASLRNQYTIGYSPINRARDGKVRKIKVQLVDAQGNPLVVQDQKGKKVKYVIYAREGYTVPKSGVSD